MKYQLLLKVNPLSLHSGKGQITDISLVVLIDQHINISLHVLSVPQDLLKVSKKAGADTTELEVRKFPLSSVAYAVMVTA